MRSEHEMWPFPLETYRAGRKAYGRLKNALHPILVYATRFAGHGRARRLK